jgi:hypothetical protein
VVRLPGWVVQTLFDAAEGPNRMQNYPEFDNLAPFFNEDTGMIDYSCRVRTNPENADYPLIIDFYLADGTSDAGETYLGSDSYPSSSANAFRTGTLSLPPGVNPQGPYLVATATDIQCGRGSGQRQYQPVHQYAGISRRAER